MTNEAPSHNDVLADILGRHRWFAVGIAVAQTDGVRTAEAYESVERFARKHLLDIVTVDKEQGIVLVRSPKKGIEDTFGVRMVVVTRDGVRYRTIIGRPTLDADVARHVSGIIGLTLAPGEPVAVVPQVAPAAKTLA